MKKLLLASILCITPLNAQELVTSSGTTNFVVSVPIKSKIMASISESGEVKIDWKAVEEALDGSNRQLKTYAQLMLAIRDNTWKELKNE